MKTIIPVLIITSCSILFFSGCTLIPEKINEHPTNLHSGTELPLENKRNDTPALPEEIEKEITLTGSSGVSSEYDTSFSQAETLFE